MSSLQSDSLKGADAGERTVGTCYGFAIRSSLDFLFLRAEDGEAETLRVTAPSTPPDGDAGELIQQWRPAPDLPFEGSLYRDGTRFQFQTAQSRWFFIDVDGPSVTLPEDPNTVRREERLWGIPAILCFLARGDLQLHAAALEIEGEAIVIGAPRTHGKTTLAATFHNAGFRLLNEDVTCICDLSAPHIVPGPAVLRLRRDTAERLEIRNVTEVGQRDDRVHFAIDPALRGDCRPLPLKALLLLRESAEGYRLDRAAPADAVRDLWPLSFNLPDPRDRARCFAALTDLTRTTPVWNLYRPFRLEDLPGAVNFVVEHV